MVPHSSTLAWKIPWMEEPGRLQSLGSLRVRHDWLSRIGEGNGNPLQYSSLENPRDGGCHLWGCRVGHDWSDLAAAAAHTYMNTEEYVMQNARLDEVQAGIKIVGRYISNLRYADDTSHMAESKEELKSLLMKVKDESEKAGLKLNIQKMKIMASSLITSWQIDGEIMETVTNFLFLGSKITTDSDCSYEIKRCLLLGKKSCDQPRQHIKRQRHYFAN